MARYDITREELHVMDGGAMRTLRRIRALSHNGMAGTHPGDMGGWIEDASNLSQEGCCWVADGAMAYGGAVLKGDAVLHGRSVARGGAVLAGNTALYDSVADGGAAVDTTLTRTRAVRCRMAGASAEDCNLADCIVGAARLEGETLERECLLHLSDAARLKFSVRRFCVPQAAIDDALAGTWLDASRPLLDGDVMGELASKGDGTRTVRLRGGFSLVALDRFLTARPSGTVRAWRLEEEDGRFRFAREHFALAFTASGAPDVRMDGGAAVAEYRCTLSDATLNGLAGSFDGGAALDRFPRPEDIVRLVRGMRAQAVLEDGVLFAGKLDARAERVLAEAASKLADWAEVPLDEPLPDAMKLAYIGNDLQTGLLDLAGFLESAR